MTSPGCSLSGNNGNASSHSSASTLIHTAIAIDDPSSPFPSSVEDSPDSAKKRPLRVAADSTSSGLHAALGISAQFPHKSGGQSDAPAGDAMANGTINNN